MAEVVPAGDAILLIEHHCPICVAATKCQAFCRSELAIFRDVLGPRTTVERLEHLIAGARRCVYRIAERGQGKTLVIASEAKQSRVRK